MSDLQWFYADASGTQQGPVDAAFLQAAVQRGDLSLDSMVWRDGLGQWTPIRQLTSELGISLHAAGNPSAGTPPPPPPQAPPQAAAPPPPPSAAPPPPSASPYAAAGADFVASVKSGVNALGGAKSADDVVRIAKGNKPLMAAGAGVAIVLLIVIFKMVGSGGPPGCDSDDVQPLVRKVLARNELYNSRLSGIKELSYDSKSETRSCQADVEGGEMAGTIHYTVWQDKAAKKVYVQLQQHD